MSAHYLFRPFETNLSLNDSSIIYHCIMINNKTLLIVLITLGVTVSSSAQTTSGIVKYQKRVPLRKKLGDEWIGYKDQIPETAAFNYLLYFSSGESLFSENSKENEAPSPIIKKAMWTVNKWAKPYVKTLKIYFNRDKNLQVRQTEFMTRLFREELDMPIYKFKMGIATKEILGYKCMQAEIEIDNKEILAWFTADIPVSAGPEKYYGLPGLILEVNVNHGEQVWIATSIDLTVPEKNQLFEPKEGKKVKTDQYIKIQEEKIEEWEKQQKMKKSDKVVRIKK